MFSLLLVPLPVTNPDPDRLLAFTLPLSRVLRSKGQRDLQAYLQVCSFLSLVIQYGVLLLGDAQFITVTGKD